MDDDLKPPQSDDQQPDFFPIAAGEDGLGAQSSREPGTLAAANRPDVELNTGGADGPPRGGGDLQPTVGETEWAPVRPD
jgi:hypothetical protein